MNIKKEYMWFNDITKKFVGDIRFIEFDEVGRVQAVGTPMKNTGLLKDLFVDTGKEQMSYNMHCTLHTSIGLYDSENKPIYPGHILRSVIDNTLNDWLVEFNDGHAQFVCVGKKGYFGDRINLTKEMCEYRTIVGHVATGDLEASFR